MQRILVNGRYNKWHAYANGKPSVRGDGRARRKAARKQRREDEENELAYKIVTSGNFHLMEEGASSRHGRKRLIRRVEIAKRLLEAGELPLTDGQPSPDILKLLRLAEPGPPLQPKKEKALS
mmetsp:Transcript_31166/g.60144  ORF Transcript_31166/g.60144 Transcript_31166/m.60144 type:complete len:122 (-) Transcript_31166:261-626(-)